MIGWEQKSLMVLLLFSCAWMAAVGWYVQLVHYPAFLDIRADQWPEFHARHSNMTGVVVIVPMLLQFFGTVGLFFLPERPPVWFLAAMVIACAFSFGWTFFVSGPLHGTLGNQNGEAIRRLVSTNWPRAVGWTVQALLAGFWLIAKP